MEPSRLDDVAAIVAAVIQQAVRDGGRSGLVVLDGASPEARLALDWAANALGRDRVLAVGGDGAGPAEPDRAEHDRAEARIIARERDWDVAHPANKTALLLCRELPPESLLPLGDLYASDVSRMIGECSLPDDVPSLAEISGGLERLDGALGNWLEGRQSMDRALAGLPAAARQPVRQRLLRNRAGRRWPRRVPKLGGRTLWIDLFV